MLQRLDYSRFREIDTPAPDYSSFRSEYVVEGYEIRVGALVLGPFTLVIEVDGIDDGFMPGRCFRLSSVHYDGEQSFTCRAFGSGGRQYAQTVEAGIEAEVSKHIEDIWPQVEEWAAEEAAMGRG